jgi:Holliday junction resolvase
LTVNSKQKGNAGELQLSKVLSTALGGSFVRSNASGAFIGGKNSFRKKVLSENQIKNTKGDIVPPDDMTHLVIECKSYNLFRYHQIFQECPMLDGWITQARESADSDDFWILVFKANRMPWSIVFDHTLMGRFGLGNYAVYNNKTGRYVITDLDVFLSENKDKINQLGKDGLA